MRKDLTRILDVLITAELLASTSRSIKKLLKNEGIADSAGNVQDPDKEYRKVLKHWVDGLVEEYGVGRVKEAMTYL